jgi:hypothetical protein
MGFGHFSLKQVFKRVSGKERGWVGVVVGAEYLVSEDP